MNVEERAGPIAEVHCLNCGRLLAQAVRDGERQTIALQPAAHRASVEVVVAGRRRLRCAHCGGRAFVELLGASAERRGALRLWKDELRYGTVVRTPPLASRTRSP